MIAFTVGRVRGPVQGMPGRDAKSSLPAPGDSFG